jgi:hypothetical protein
MLWDEYIERCPRRYRYSRFCELAGSPTRNTAALVAGQVAVEKEVRVQAVRYVPNRDAIEIVTTRNAGFLIRRAWIGGLQDVPTENLARLKIWPVGSAIELEDRDIRSACMA